VFLKINDKYAIEANENCWAISKRVKEPKAGKFWKQIAWYQTLENATNGLLQREIRCLEVDSLNDAIKGVQGLSRELTEALSPKYEVKLKENDES
jgi:hypothetical protein